MATSTKCDICVALKFDATATFTCIQCQKQMCNGCTAKHSGDRLLAHHNVVRMLLAEGLHLQCAQHPHEKLQQYCVTCKTPICIVCVLSLHDDHDKQGLQGWVEAQRQHVDMLAEEADLKTGCGLQAQGELEELMAAVTGDMEQARETLHEHHSMLVEALDSKHALLQKDLAQIYKAKQQALTLCRDEVQGKLYRLADYTQLARKLSASDARLIRVTPRFMAGFYSALDVEPEDMEELEKQSHICFIPSYDINIGTFGGEVTLDITAIQRDSVFRDDLDTTTASLWSTTESGSLGFHEDHWHTSIGGDLEPLHSSSVGQWETCVPSSPSRRISSSQSMSNLNVNDEYTTRISFGQISPIRELKSQSLLEPKLIFTIDYKGVTSQSPAETETYATAPIDVEFKNEHKLFVTQWGVDPKGSKGATAVQYRQAKVGMVLYSMCCDQPAVVTSFEDCSPWCVTSCKGEYLVSDLRNNSRTLRKYRADGALNNTWMEHIINTPRGVTTHKDQVIITDTHHRNVYVVQENKHGHAHRINSIGAVGKLRRFRSESNLNATPVCYSDTQFVNPLFVTCNSTGLILVSDAGDNSIKIYNQRGEWLMQINETKPGDPLDTPMGVCLDTIDNIYVSDYGNHRVCKFNKHGQYLGDAVSAGKGGVYHPRGVDVYAGFLAVACHSRECEPQVKIFELGQQLARQTEPPCECQWLRLCADH